MTAHPLDIPDYLKAEKSKPMPAFKPLVYSFTMLKTADTCLYKAYRQYIKRDLPFDKTPEIKFGEEVHQAMEYRLGGKPLPVHMQIWEPLAVAYVERKAMPEMKTGVTREGKPTGFFDKDVWLRCKIDTTIVRDKSAFLSDWKTGSSKYEDPFELQIQALTLTARMGLTKISGNYIYLKENKIGQAYDLSDFNSTWAKINNKVEVIEDALRSDEWPKRKNPLCPWCGVLDCENNPKRTS